MNSFSNASPKCLRLTWLVPDDHGGGVVSVAQACCLQAANAGHDVTLLMLLPATGHAAEFGSFRVESLRDEPPYAKAPSHIVEWLRQNPQDVVFLNGCEQADIAIPYVPAGTRIVYVVHDTASRYFNGAIKHENAIDLIVAVSETVASRFRNRLKEPEKLHVIHNGSIFPLSVENALDGERADDLIFLGGDNPIKGAFDVLAVWDALQGKGFAGCLHWFGHIGLEFQNQIAKMPGSERIILHGRRLRLEIFQTAKRSRVLLMLSRVEPFGMVTVECMGMGCLTAAWDIATGTREIVHANEYVFAALGDYEHLAVGIMELISTHETRYEASTRRIRTEFDDGAMWRKYHTLLDMLRTQTAIVRPLSLSAPPRYKTPFRVFQLLPPRVRQAIRGFVGRWPRLGYMFRDFRGR